MHLEVGSSKGASDASLHHHRFDSLYPQQSHLNQTTRSADGVSQSKELMLDMSVFGSPEAISQSDWQDAWINRLEIIKETSEKDIYKYFKAHKKYISQQEDFAEQFEAYKRFDIYFCRHYSNTRFKVNSQQYSAKVLEFKLKFPAALFVDKPFSLLHSAQASASQHQHSRYALYDRSKGPASGSSSSFPKGTNSSILSGQCLICRRAGHRGRDCNYSTTEEEVAAGRMSGPLASFASFAICLSTGVYASR